MTGTLDAFIPEEPKDPLETFRRISCHSSRSAKSKVRAISRLIVKIENNPLLIQRSHLLQQWNDIPPGEKAEHTDLKKKIDDLTDEISNLKEVRELEDTGRELYNICLDAYRWAH